MTELAEIKENFQKNLENYFYHKQQFAINNNVILLCAEGKKVNQPSRKNKTKTALRAIKRQSYPHSHSKKLSYDHLLATGCPHAHISSFKVCYIKLTYVVSVF